MVRCRLMKALHAPLLWLVTTDRDSLREMMQDAPEYGLVVLDQVGWDSVIVHGHESGMPHGPRRTRRCIHLSPTFDAHGHRGGAKPRLGGPSITPPGLGSARLRKRPLHSP